MNCLAFIERVPRMVGHWLDSVCRLYLHELGTILLLLLVLLAWRPGVSLWLHLT